MNLSNFLLALFVFPLLLVVIPIIAIFWIYVVARIAFNLMARACIAIFLVQLIIGLITLPVAIWLINKMNESGFMENYFSLNYKNFSVYKWVISCYQYLSSINQDNSAKHWYQKGEES